MKGLVKGQRAKDMVTEDDLTFGSGHTMQHTEHVSQKCILEIYTMSLTKVTQIHLHFF